MTRGEREGKVVARTLRLQQTMPEREGEREREEREEREREKEKYPPAEAVKLTCHSLCPGPSAS